ncbi:hypothetical protein [Priestia megaterium]|uniref:hypothetical protein n=1 Tax=Priestia megaterium TaxID=1404 RepID=UPI0025B225B6|nr:hypothetical protein [Priestia megaterium]MDN3233372.1 hypothetical protein [Priestia megaterium]
MLVESLSRKSTENIYTSMVKADLHVHLNGAVPTETIKCLIDKYNVQLPKNFCLDKDLQILKPVNGLMEYFVPWKAFKSLPIGRDCLNAMIRETLRTLALDNITYVELKNSPFYISKINNIPLVEGLNWLTEGLKEYSEMFKINAKLILSFTRHELNMDETENLLKAIKKVNNRDIIVGIDMSGNEDIPIPKDLANVFIRAKKELGLGITIHAGETGNVENIIWAINQCGADRIGHGLAAYKSPEVMELIKQKEVCLEICLISNLRTGCCPNIEEHPVNKFIEYDVPFILCTDNPAVHQSTLSEEYEFFVRQFGRSDIIKDMLRRQKKYAFCNNFKLP